MHLPSPPELPHGLKEAEDRKTRLDLLTPPRLESLNDMLTEMRADDSRRKIPNFDPFDGGADAEVLFVLEVPGPKAVETGFISRDNPDATAKNFFELLREVEINREQSLLWNIVPYCLGDGQKNWRPKLPNIDDGLKWLYRLIHELPKLRALVLVGRQAQRVEHRLKIEPVRLFKTYHPSPQFINRKKPENRAKLKIQLGEVAGFLRSPA